jgi:SAM-dependent methyltransferase
VGCGPGRHSIELAKRGYHVVGIDPSAAMISAAWSKAVEAGIFLDFQQVAGENFVSDTTFDAAICLFTTLGQIENQKDNRQLIAQVAKCLKPGGFLVVEVPQRDWVAANLKPEDKFGADDHYTEIVRQLNTVGDTVTEVFTLISPDENQQYVLRYRLFSLAELRTLLKCAGFEIVGIFGGYDTSPLTPESPIMLAIAQHKGIVDQ